MALIEVINVTKNYAGNPPVEVLKGVSISIQEKEIISIVGASGAGKSTLLHIIGTLDQASEGKVLFRDTDITKLSNKALNTFRNKNLGFVFQFHHLLPEFSAVENVMIPAIIGGAKEKEAKTKALALLDLLNLSHRINNKPHELSGGEQQRVAVARSLINNPAIVLADEPSGNLDAKNADELHHMFFKLRQDFGTSFLIVTHNEILANMADRKLVMKDGLIVTP